MSVIDKYLAKIEPTKRAKLEEIRSIAKELVPDAQEVISYGMPTLKHQGKPFLGFNIHKNHIGVYPYGSEEIELYKDKLIKLNLRFSSGAIRIPFTTPVPKDLPKSIIKHRISRISGK